MLLIIYNKRYHLKAMLKIDVNSNAIAPTAGFIPRGVWLTIRTQQPQQQLLRC